MPVLYRARYLDPRFSNGVADKIADLEKENEKQNKEKEELAKELDALKNPPKFKVLVASEEREVGNYLTKDDFDRSVEVHKGDMITFGTDQPGKYGYWAIAIPTDLIQHINKIYLQGHELVGDFQLEEVEIGGKSYHMIQDFAREELATINIMVE